MCTQLPKDTRQKLKLLVFQHLELEADMPEEEVAQDTISQWSSTRHLSLIMEIEAQFKVSFKIEDVVKMQSFEEIVNHLETKLAQRI